MGYLIIYLFHFNYYMIVCLNVKSVQFRVFLLILEVSIVFRHFYNFKDFRQFYFVFCRHILLYIVFYKSNLNKILFMIFFRLCIILMIFLLILSKK